MQNGKSEHTYEAARSRRSFYRMLRRPSNRTFQPFNGLPNSDVTVGECVREDPRRGDRSPVEHTDAGSPSVGEIKGDESRREEHSLRNECGQTGERFTASSPPRL
jgi:hypothetical protein